MPNTTMKTTTATAYDLANAAADRALAKHEALAAAATAATAATSAAFRAYRAAGGSANPAASESAWNEFNRLRAAEKIAHRAANRAWGHLNAAWKRRDAARIAL